MCLGSFWHSEPYNVCQVWGIKREIGQMKLAQEEAIAILFCIPRFLRTKRCLLLPHSPPPFPPQISGNVRIVFMTTEASHASMTLICVPKNSCPGRKGWNSKFIVCFRKFLKSNLSKQILSSSG